MLDVPLNNLLSSNPLVLQIVYDTPGAKALSLALQPVTGLPDPRPEDNQTQLLWILADAEEQIFKNSFETDLVDD